ncbi:MAG: DNA primase [Clostridia bacterium]|nr:DNA primase [Clostridia bacterium]MBQ3554375.1 DNA primase [Clostridia bacterium]
MARYSQNSIREVARRNDIVDVVSSYVKLKRNGNSHTGLCPFHKEKTPSFHVSEDKQLYYCFGCGAGGNLFDFIMKIENLDFVDALKFLAQRAGVTLEEEKGAYVPTKEETDAKQRVYEMNVLAARHFVENLRDPSATLAHAYVKKRGLGKDTITRFGIGYAKDDWSDLCDFLKQKGYTEQEIVTAGLAVKNEKGRVYDKFRNRLMFPIINVRGNVVAFGGRALGDDPAKYMNSPETPVFHKGSNVYNLNNAKQYGRKDGLILVEGYMDVASLHQSGIENAIAGLGTAFTPEQATLLKRYAGQIFVCYDGDEAGQNAALKAIDILAEAGNKIKVVRFSGAKDPDEYIAKKGAESFRKCIADAVSAVEFKIMSARNDFDLTDVDGKIAFVTRAANILSKIDSQIEREAYVNRIAAESGISANAILTEINKLIYREGKKTTQNAKYAERREDEQASQAVSTEASGQIATYKAERMLLNVIFFQRKAFELAKEELSGDLFAGVEHRKIYEAMLTYKLENPEADASDFLSYVDEPLKKTVAAILYREYECDSLQAAKDMIKKLKGELMNSKIKQLAKEGKAEEVQALIKKYAERRG